MNIIFANDHIFYKFKDSFYSNGSFSGDVLKRYTDVFENIIILSRQKEILSFPKTMTKATTPNVTFIKVPDFKSISKIKNIIKAKKVIKDEVRKSDGVIARLPSSIGNIAIRYGKKFNKPYALEVVGCPWDSLWNYGNIQGKILAPIEYFKLKKITKKSKYTLYVTKNFLQNRYPTKGKTTNVSNVELPTPKKEILDNRIRKIDNYNENEKIKIGMIGALTSKFKGFDLAIKALSDLNKIFNNIELHILGKGDPKKWINFSKKYNIENNIIFEGTLPSGEPVFKWLDKIDVFIQPSKQEGLPRALIEAMSRGCPAVGSKTGGIPELLDENFIHKKGDYKDLYNKIYFLLSDRNIMLTQAKRNFEVSKLYSKKILDERRTVFWQDFKNTI